MIRRQTNDYKLTTAEILYRMPDHPTLLQSFIWQEIDLAPQYPGLQKFLAFWRRELDADLHSVRVASAPLGRHGRVRHVGAFMNIH